MIIFREKDFAVSRNQLRTNKRKAIISMSLRTMKEIMKSIDMNYNKIKRMKVNVNKKVYIEPDQATKILTKAIDSVLSGGGSNVIKKLEV